MCGRFTNKLTWDEIMRLYRLTIKAPPHNLPPRYNICPTDPVDVVTERDGNRDFVRMRWGLVPSWWPKPLKELKAATFLGSIVLCTALLHRKCVGRIALKSDGDDKCTSRYCNLTEDHGSGSLNYPHPRTHHSIDFEVLLGPREWTLPYLTVRNCCLR